MFGAKAEIALREKGVDFELVMVDFTQANGYSPKHPEVLRINPKGQVPVLIDGEVEIYDSTQIFEYCEDRWSENELWPMTIPARARARQLEHASDEVFFPNVITLMKLRATPDPVDSPEWIKARENIEAYYGKINALLSDGRDFLTGPFTYADISFYMAQLFAARHTVPMGSQHAHLLAWRKRIGERPSVRTVVDRMANYLRSINYPVPTLA